MLLHQACIRFVHFAKDNVERHEGALACHDWNQSDFGQSEFPHVTRNLLAPIAVRVAFQGAKDVHYELFDTVVFTSTYVCVADGFRASKGWGVHLAAGTRHQCRDRGSARTFPTRIWGLLSERWRGTWSVNACVR